MSSFIKLTAADVRCRDGDGTTRGSSWEARRFLTPSWRSWFSSIFITHYQIIFYD